MRRLILAAIFLFLLCQTASAANIAQAMMGVCKVGAVSCNVSTDYVGNKSVVSAPVTMTIDVMRCVRYAASCAGTTNCTTNTASMYSHTSSGTPTGTVCIYNDAGTAGSADSSDQKQACAASIGSGKTQWNTAAMDTAYAVTNGTYYWVCSIIGGETYPGATGDAVASGVAVYRACEGCAASPPANLDGSWTNATYNRSIYITVGP